MFGKKSNNNQPDYEYFTLCDTKVGVYREPMLAINQFDMVRQIQSLFKDPAQQQNQIVTNAEDFSLFKVGAFTKKTGEITPCTHEHIANVIDIKIAIQREKGQVGIQAT